MFLRHSSDIPLGYGPWAELIQRKMKPGLQMRWLKANPVVVIVLSPGLEAGAAMAIWTSEMEQLEVRDVPGILEPVQGSG